MKICQLVVKILRGNEISGLINCYNSDANVRKMICNIPKLDLAKMNAYIKFGEIQDIEPKQMLMLLQGKRVFRCKNSGVSLTFLASGYQGEVGR